MSANEQAPWHEQARKYQLENAEWLTNLPFGVRGRLLTDGLGTGKTRSALAAMRMRFDKGLMECPVMLVFTTASSAHDWGREASRFWPECRVFIVGSGSKSKRKGEDETAFNKRRHPWKQVLAEAASNASMPPTLIVADYWWADQVGKLVMEQHEVLLDSLTLDEAHLVKKAGSSRAKAITMLVARTRQTTMLTGTPVHNRPHDLHNLLKLCKPSTPGFWTWARSYFHITLNDRNFQVVGGLKDKDQLVHDIKPLVSGRTAQELMGDDLPARNYQLKYVEVEGAVKVSPAKLHAKKTEGVEALLRDMVRHKLSAAVEIARDADKPLVLYTYRREDAQKLAKELQREKLTVTLATGDQTAQARDKAIESWKLGATQCLVCTMDAVRESATLTRADLMVFVDLHWLPAVLLQCQGRIDPARQPEGQRRPVTYLYIVVKGGPDEVVAEVISEKIRDASGIGVKNQQADKLGSFLHAEPVVPKVDPDTLMNELVERIVAREQRLTDLEVL